MNKFLKFSVILVLSLFVLPDVSTAQTEQAASGLPLPRFVSLRSDKVNMRTGPGFRYPIDWVYKRLNMPMEVVAEFGTWRKVRDFQGTEGWINKAMLRNKRTLAVTGQTRTLRFDSDSQSPAVARIEPSVTGKIIRCRENAGWCKLSFGKYEGWLRRVEFWGAYPTEKIN